MTNVIFNANKTDYEAPSLLLGKSAPGLFDTINKQYPKIWDLYKLMKKLDWDENEFNYSSCNVEFKTCPPSTYDMMIRTLAWQWEADSVAARMVLPVGAPFISSPELLAAWSAVNTNECVTGDHEVLTPKGWIRIDQITQNDKVAQWNYITKEIKFVNPQEIIIKQHDGLMYHFYDGNRNLSQVVTPNHRMPVVYPYWTNEDQPQFKFAQDSHYHGGNGLPTTGYINSGGRRMSAQERLYIAVQADGTICSDNYTGSRTGQKHYRFSFSKQRKIDRLLELCRSANWYVSEMNHSVDVHNLRSFYVYVPLSEYNPLAKTFDWFNLDEIGYEWAMDFLDEIKHWDGNITESGRTRYISSNKECIDKVVALAHITGHRGHVTVIPSRFNVLMPGGCFSDTKEAYQVHITRRPYITGNSVIKTAIDYTGNVYCLTVPTGYFLVRHNDAVSVTGNCLHAAAYSEIVRNSFDDPKEVLSEILKVTESLQRLDTVSESFKKAYLVSHQYALGMVENDQETYNAAYMFVVTMLVLERIQFMASFAITFCICDTGLFQPIGKAVQKIAQDEFEVHVQVNKAVIEYEHKTVRGQLAKQQCKTKVQAIVDEVVASEFKWLGYMFSDGRELVGANADLLKKWVLFNAKEIIEIFELDSKHELPKVNPLKFMENWLNIGKTQPSPQEQANGQYKLNVMVRDDAMQDFAVDF